MYIVSQYQQASTKLQNVLLLCIDYKLAFVYEVPWINSRKLVVDPNNQQVG
jgi:hypothetical protein